jgi:hypothetical protein
MLFPDSFESGLSLAVIVQLLFVPLVLRIMHFRARNVSVFVEMLVRMFMDVFVAVLVFRLSVGMFVRV